MKLTIVAGCMVFVLTAAGSGAGLAPLWRQILAMAVMGAICFGYAVAGSQEGREAGVPMFWFVG